LYGNDGYVNTTQCYMYIACIICICPYSHFYILFSYVLKGINCSWCV